MINFTRFNEHGEYTAAVTGTFEGLKFEDAHRIFIGEHPGFNYYHDIKSNTPIAMPIKPSEYHIFDYNIKQWVDPRTVQDHIDAIRAKRNKLLTDSDWTQLLDVQLANKQVWADYRQALRDTTKQPDPLNIVWPTMP